MKSENKPMTPLEMQQTTEEIMRDLGVGINAALKTYFPSSGFTLLVFPVVNPGVCNYISNADRRSMITALKAAVKKLDKNEDIPADSGTVH